MACRQCSELFDMAREEHTRTNHQRGYLQFVEFGKDAVKLTFGSGVEDMDFQPQSRSRLQHFSLLW